MCSYYIQFCLVAEWPTFGKELLTRLTICSLYILTICNTYFPFGFWGQDLGSDFFSSWSLHTFFTFNFKVSDLFVTKKKKFKELLP